MIMKQFLRKTMKNVAAYVELFSVGSTGVCDSGAYYKAYRAVFF